MPKKLCNIFCGFIYIANKEKLGLGTNLRKLRSKTKYSQLDISDLLGIDRNTYANWENEKNDVKSEFIPKLAKIFNVEIKVLFEEKINSVRSTLK
ncbi:helix-turn-helix domain-containing protein [Paenimyroides ceti]